MLLCVELSKFASSQELIHQINCCISVGPTGVLECCLQISSIVFFCGQLLQIHAFTIYVKIVLKINGLLSESCFGRFQDIFLRGRYGIIYTQQ